jgi:hypothetical protein
MSTNRPSFGSMGLPQTAHVTVFDMSSPLIIELTEATRIVATITSSDMTKPRDRTHARNVQELRADFSKAHHAGIHALVRHDYKKVGRVIRYEADLIQELRDHIEAARLAHKERTWL